MLSTDNDFMIIVGILSKNWNKKVLLVNNEVESGLQCDTEISPRYGGTAFLLKCLWKREHYMDCMKRIKFIGYCTYLRVYVYRKSTLYRGFIYRSFGYIVGTIKSLDIFRVAEPVLFPTTLIHGV